MVGLTNCQISEFSNPQTERGKGIIGWKWCGFHGEDVGYFMEIARARFLRAPVMFGRLLWAHGDCRTKPQLFQSSSFIVGSLYLCHPDGCNSDMVTIDYWCSSREKTGKLDT